MIVHKHDTKTGLFLEDVIIEPDADGNYQIPSDCTDIQPVGLHTPKWDGTQWIEGDGTAALGLIRENKRYAINDEYIKQLEAGVTYSGALFQSDAKSIATLSETLTAVTNGWALPASFAWIDAANTPHPADLAFLKGLAAALANHKAALFARLQAAKQALAATADQAAVDAVVF